MTSRSTYNRGGDFLGDRRVFTVIHWPAVSCICLPWVSDLIYLVFKFWTIRFSGQRCLFVLLVGHWSLLDPETPYPPLWYIKFLYIYPFMNYFLIYYIYSFTVSIIKISFIPCCVNDNKELSYRIVLLIT